MIRYDSIKMKESQENLQTFYERKIISYTGSTKFLNVMIIFFIRKERFNLHILQYFKNFSLPRYLLLINLENYYLTLFNENYLRHIYIYIHYSEMIIFITFGKCTHIQRKEIFCIKCFQVIQIAIPYLIRCFCTCCPLFIVEHSRVELFQLISRHKYRACHMANITSYSSSRLVSSSG